MRAVPSPTPLAVLLVHGMGRSPLSMAWLGYSLKRQGLEPYFFGYIAAVESVERIVARLIRRIQAVAAEPYLVVGHSLGGVLLRVAVAQLPADVRRPERMILLASPHRSPRLARRFAGRLWYRAITGDAGQMLADVERMDAVPEPVTAYSLMVGTRGLSLTGNAFGDEPNDGIVAVSEAIANSDGMEFRLPRMHTLLMNAPEVCEHIQEIAHAYAKDSRC